MKAPVLAADANRSVLQCGCGRAITWRGDEAATKAGWRPDWRCGAAGPSRTWLCPECYVPAPESPAAEPTIPRYLWTLLEDRKRFALAQEQLETIRLGDPPRFAAYLAYLVEWLELLPKGQRVRWRAYAKRNGVTAPKGAAA